MLLLCDQHHLHKYDGAVAPWISRPVVIWKGSGEGTILGKQGPAGRPPMMVTRPKPHVKHTLRYMLLPLRELKGSVRAGLRQERCRFNAQSSTHTTTKHPEELTRKWFSSALPLVSPCPLPTLWQGAQEMLVRWSGDVLRARRAYMHRRLRKTSKCLYLGPLLSAFAAGSCLCHCAGTLRDAAVPHATAPAEPRCQPLGGHASQPLEQCSEWQRSFIKSLATFMLSKSLVWGLTAGLPCSQQSPLGLVGVHTDVPSSFIVHFVYLCATLCAKG